MGNRPGLWIVALAVALVSPGAMVRSAEQVTKGDDGKYRTSEGTPTYHIAQDGTVDWYTYSGYRRYNSECIVCHGPDGEGSTFAPALVNSLKTMTYDQFMNIVAGGKQDVNAAQNQVMPSFGTNRNVMCYIDDIYVYLKARADGAVPRNRPAKHEEKPEAAAQYEDSCLGPPS
jgi:methanol metabolism-related c-type cytochrome